MTKNPNDCDCPFRTIKKNGPAGLDSPSANCLQIAPAPTPSSLPSPNRTGKPRHIVGSVNKHITIVPRIGKSRRSRPRGHQSFRPPRLHHSQIKISQGRTRMNRVRVLCRLGYIFWFFFQYCAAGLMLIDGSDRINCACSSKKDRDEVYDGSGALEEEQVPSTRLSPTISRSSLAKCARRPLFSRPTP